MGETLIQLVLSGIVLGCIYGLIGIGFSTVHSSTGAINFAQGEFAVIGAFLCISLVGAGLPFFLSSLLSPLLLTAFVVLVFIVFLRRVAGDPLYLVVSTIALSLMLRTVALYFWGREPLGISSAFAGRTLKIFSGTLTFDQVLVVASAALLYIVLFLIFSKTFTGRAMKAVVEEREIAMASGLNPLFYQGFSFALGAFLGAFSGCIFSPIAMLSYFSGGLLGLKGFASAVLAGLEEPQKVIFGGIILGLVESFAVLFVPSGYKDMVALIILLLVLTLKPEGILTRSRRRIA